MATQVDENTYTLMTHMECGKCGISFMVPASFKKEQRELGSRGGWSCPNGHRRIYRKSDLEEAQEQFDYQKAQLTARVDQLEASRIHLTQQNTTLEYQRRAAKGQLTRMRNRIANGVCPGCHRSFTNVRRHMKTKHPDMLKKVDTEVT